MQVVSDQQSRMKVGSTDWVDDSDFAMHTLAGELLGVTGEGHGVYVQEATAEVWNRDHQWESTATYLVTRVVPDKEAHPEFRVAFCPPPGEQLDDATETFDSKEELGQYVLNLAKHNGPWKALTANGWKALAYSEINL